jgi:hypothetical protein
MPEHTGLHKWTLEVATVHDSTENNLLGRVVRLLADDTSFVVPSFKYHFDELTMAQSRDDFAIDEDTLREFYETCRVCGGAIEEGREFIFDDATYDWLGENGVDRTGFVYDSQACRLDHLRQLIYRLERTQPL